MLRITAGDILSCDAEALVNTVNCVGVMGRGVALQFKRAYPDNFKQYQKACARGEVIPGRMFVVENAELTGPRCIVNFPTKRDWKNKSQLEDIESGLAALVAEIHSRGIRSIAIPPSLASCVATLPASWTPLSASSNSTSSCISCRRRGSPSGSTSLKPITAPTRKTCVTSFVA